MYIYNRHAVKYGNIVICSVGQKLLLIHRVRRIKSNILIFSYNLFIYFYLYEYLR